MPEKEKQKLRKRWENMSNRERQQILNRRPLPAKAKPKGSDKKISNKEKKDLREKLRSMSPEERRRYMEQYRRQQNP